jgi:AraC-like DNA-binding protein
MPRNQRELSRSRTAPPENRATPAPMAQPSPRMSGAKTGNASSFAARFGRVILQHGVAAIPSALYHFQGRLGLTAQQVWFVSYILAHKWAEALPHPSMNKMAQCTGVDRRVLQYRCAELTNLGLLQIQPRYGERGDQDTNYFDFSGLFEQLEEILLDEPVVPNPIRDAEGRQSSTDLASLDAGETYSRGAAGSRITRSAHAVLESASHASGDGAELDYSFLARYGRVLLRYGIATVPRAIFTHQVALGLTPQQVWFVCYILSFQWDTSLPYPSINKMAERTGYSKRQLLRIKDDLVAERYLEVVRRTSSDRGNDSNAYDFSLLFDAIRRHLQAPEETRDTAAPGQIEADPGTDESSMDEQITGTAGEAVEPQSDHHRRRRPPQPRSRSAGSPTKPVESPIIGNVPVERRVTRGIDHDVTRGVEQRVTRGMERSVTRPVEQLDTRAVAQDVTGLVSPNTNRPWQGRSPGGQKPESPEIEARKREELHEDDSNQHPQKIGSGTTKMNVRMPAYSPYIAGVAADFSRELGDAVHEASNMKQAINLWKDSGLGEGQFVELMQKARKLTRRYQSRPTWDALNNKMAYLFTTLRDLIAQATEG